MSGTHEARLAAGAQFGAYRVVRPLGEGAAGAVYEVIKTSVGKRMALKVLHRSLHGGGDDLVRFQREAMIAGAIEHPNVVQVFDVGELDGHRYMAMELLEGETLEDRLKRDGALPIRDVADLFVPLMSALGAVHDQGIVHRDLKPGNIFLVARRPGVVEPKLLDFGVIKDLTGIVGGDITSAHAMVGSPAYMSPEQAERPNAIDVRSDQFTVGSTLWECLIGRKLFEGDTLYQVLFQVAEGPIPPPASWRHDIPPSLEAAVLRALERDPAKRFGSARELGAALLPHCAEHVRAVWRDELAPFAPPEPAVEREAYDDDERTRMIPAAEPGGATRLRAPTMQAPMGFHPMGPPSPMGPPTPMRAPTPTRSSAPPMAPAPTASSPPMPQAALQVVPNPQWQAPPDASGRFPGQETFQPRARAVTQVIAPQKSGAPWGVILAVVGVLALAVTIVVGTHRSAAVPTEAAAPPVAVVAPTPRVVAPPVPAVAPADAAVPASPPAPSGVQAPTLNGRERETPPGRGRRRGGVK